MASLNHRLNPLFSIKECTSCRALYTADFCCSKGGLKDKIVPKPPQNCATCGDPVDGLYCRPCAFVRKCLNEGWYTIHDKNEILNTSESSNHNTNVVSAPQEPFVFNQDPGQNSSQSAHYGYNCPPQIPIISNLEPCYNQNLNEILQNLQSLQQQSFLGTCQQCGCNEYDGVCFYCTVGNGTQINFSTPYSSNDSPNFANHPPQPQYETNICELCGNDAHFGYDCSPQVPFVYNQDPCSNQNFDYFPQTSPSFPQQCLCCENCGGPHATFQCQPMNQDFYNSNLSGFDQFQPPQFPVNYPPQETNKEILQAREDLMEAIQAFLKEYDHIPPNEKCMALLLAEERFLKIKQTMEEEQNQPENYLTFYDNDDDEYTIIYSKPKAITPDLPIEEPDNSLSMGDEHLDTIPSVDNLVPIPSEFKGISDDTCDMPVYEDPSTFNALNVHSEILSDPNDDCTSSNNDDSYENIEYVEASPLNLEYVSLEEVEPDQGRLISIVISDNSNDPLLELPEFESFHFDLYDDPSFPRPPPEPPDVEISLIVETDAPVINNFDELNEDECFDPGGGEINVEDDDSFTFVIRTFLPFLTYPEVSPLLSSTKNEDTIFDPGIST
ncbi:hypothetical protein Tco_1564108 [Tanacetum coccineum]